MMNKADLIVVGAGPGGYRAAEYAARHGLEVVIFEAANLGGTCLNEGCIPTKAYARNAEMVQMLREASPFGITRVDYDFDFRQVVERKDQVILQLRSGIETLLGQPGVTLVRQPARFEDAHTLSAVGTGETYTAPHIIVATGSEPKSLRLERCERRLLDSADLLAVQRLPQSLCIVGAGVIGMEFASIFSAFGVEVTVVEFMKECLPALDSDIAKRLRRVLEKRGVTFYMQSAVKAVTPSEVIFERKGMTEAVQAEEVLMAVGRKPRLQPDFSRAGFSCDERQGITVDENFQTTVPGIYAIGDVNGRQMLAHAAEMQAIRAVNHILGRPDHIRFDVMPAAIFTNPEAACVGPSEDQLKAQGRAYTCRKAFYRANGKALAIGEPEGMLKLLVDEAGCMIGCHVFGAHAADIVQEASVLIHQKTPVSELCDMVHIHPTLSEILRSAAEA